MLAGAFCILGTSGVEWLRGAEGVPYPSETPVSPTSSLPAPPWFAECELEEAERRVPAAGCIWEATPRGRGDQVGREARGEVEGVLGWARGLLPADEEAEARREPRV